MPTISRAYDELARGGLTTGPGTFIRNAADEAAQIPERQSGLIDLSILKPVCESIHLASRPNEISARQRLIAAEWLRFCGVRTGERNIHFTNGGTSALTVALLSVCQPGGTIVAEEVGLHTLLPQASYLAIKSRGLPIDDDDGVIPEALESACRETDVRALLILPNALCPTAFVMSESRRAANRRDCTPSRDTNSRR